MDPPSNGTRYQQLPFSSLSSSTTSSDIPFLLVPNTLPDTLHDIDDMSASKRPRPSFPVPIRIQHPAAATNSSGMSISPEDRLQIQLNQSTFKGPQHKHAHHLHSIPPREKTTRTLILDHILWQHARARFAQARAELGMNPGAAGEDNDDDCDYVTLGGSSSEPAPDCMEWTGGSKEKDAVDARAFKARADGLEKVLSAMLEQPPEELPFDADDLLFRDTSFVQPSAPVLPNGVRLRLALAGLINDVFAEDEWTVGRPPKEAEFAPYFHSPTPPLTAYTPALAALSRFSSYAHHSELPILPPFHAFAATADPFGSDAPPAQSILPPPKGSIFSSIPRGAGPESPWALGGSLGSRHAPAAGGHSGPSTFASSSSASSSSMPPPPPPSALRSGPRFSTSSIVGDMAPPPPRVYRAVGRSRDLYNAGTYARATISSQRPYRCPHHLTYTCPPSSFCISSLNAQSPIKTSKSRTTSSIGAGLSSSGPPLRRAPFSGKYGGRDARMTDLIPRFLRLSALVAVELGREARHEEDRADAVARMAIGRRESIGGTRSRAGSTVEPPASSSGASNFSYDSDEEGPGRRAKVIARPTKAWYRLLADLLTRAALQGYLVKGWKGTDAIEVLLGLGIGGPPVPLSDMPNKMPRYGERVAMHTAADDDDDDSNGESLDTDEDDKEYEPDEMPDLNEVWHILFGVKSKDSGGANVGTSREAFDDYEKLMGERISEFFTISPNCSDLSIHLDDLAHKYPSQPVDYAVLRFCEAVNKWRGRPELETVSQSYKNRTSEPPTPATATPSTSAASSLSIHSLIHPQPPAKPLIERYFSVPSKAERDAAPAWGESSSSKQPTQRRDSTGTKRSRRNSWADGKGKKVVISQAWVEEDEYVGPYGI